MRGPERADIVVWLGLAVLAAAVVIGLLPAELALTTLGLREWVAPALGAAALAAAVAAVAVGARRWLDRVPWPWLQVLCLAGATVWTAALTTARRATFDGREAGTYLGNALSTVLADLARSSSWAPAAVVGLGAGAAVVLLNAAVQSLSGEVQARRLAPALVLSPGAALLGSGMQVAALVTVCAVLALSAMASERGRGLLWSTGLALLSGVLLFAGALTGVAATAAGVGMLCIYFLRRRSLMIIVAGLGVVASLMTAEVIGWMWPKELGETSVLRLADPPVLAAAVVVAALLVGAAGGPTHRESWRKVRGTPAWPVLLTGLVAAVVAVLARPSNLGVAAAAVVWLPLLTVAASAPPRAGAAQTGPSLLGVATTALLAIGALGFLAS